MGAVVCPREAEAETSEVSAGPSFSLIPSGALDHELHKSCPTLRRGAGLYSLPTLCKSDIDLDLTWGCGGA